MNKRLFLLVPLFFALAVCYAFVSIRDNSIEASVTKQQLAQIKKDYPGYPDWYYQEKYNGDPILADLRLFAQKGEVLSFDNIAYQGMSYTETSKYLISKSLEKYHKEIPAAKRTALIQMLEKDGYFSLTTRKAKLAYINKNKPKAKYLAVVALIENINSKTIKLEEEQIAKHNKMMNEDAKVELAVKNAKEWLSFFKIVCQKSPSSQDYYDAFLDKKVWSKAGLTGKLYSKYWSDLKTNAKTTNFTPQEISRLQDVWQEIKLDQVVAKMPPRNMLRNFQISLRSWGDGYKLVVDNNNANLIDFDITGEDLIGLAYGGAEVEAFGAITLPWLKAAGTRMVAPVANKVVVPAAKFVGEKAVVVGKTIAGLFGKKTEEKVTQETEEQIMLQGQKQVAAYATKRGLYKGSYLEWSVNKLKADWDRMFSKSSAKSAGVTIPLTKAQRALREKVTANIAEAMDCVLKNMRTNGSQKWADTVYERWQSLKVRVISADDFNRLYPNNKECLGFCQWGGQEVVINEQMWLGGETISDSKLKMTLVHELFHSAALGKPSVGAAVARRNARMDSTVYSPLHEGMTEYLASKATGMRPAAYLNEVRVASELFEASNRMYGKEGTERLYQAYFLSGQDKLDGLLGIPGLEEQLHNYLAKQKYEAAINLLRKLR